MIDSATITRVQNGWIVHENYNYREVTASETAAFVFNSWDELSSFLRGKMKTEPLSDI